MNLQRAMLTSLLLILPAGCALRTIPQETLHAQVQVFGVQLHSNRDYREINGNTASEEPCLRGFERSFDQLKISIGYGFDATIRKIITRNPATSLFGIRPGMTFILSEQLLRDAGFTPYAPPCTFRNGSYLMTLLADGNGIIAGITLETAP